MVELKHVALCMDSKEHAQQFYMELLHARLVKEFEVSPILVNQIFGFDVHQNVAVMVFEVENQQFEIFISQTKQKTSFDHVCLSVENLSAFLSNCEKMKLPVYIIPRGEKELVFIKDFHGNLFEIKES